MKKIIVLSTLLAFLCIGLGITNANASQKAYDNGRPAAKSERNPNSQWVDTGKRVAVGKYLAIVGELKSKSGGPWIQAKWNSAIQQVEIVVTNWDGVSDISARLNTAAAEAAKIEAYIASGKPSHGSKRDILVKEIR